MTFEKAWEKFCLVVAASLLCGLLLVCSDPSGASTPFYCWETIGGSLGCTEALDRIPAKFENSYRVLDLGEFWDYERLTIVQSEKDV